VTGAPGARLRAARRGARPHRSAGPVASSRDNSRVRAMRASRRSLSLIFASALAIPAVSAAQEPAAPAAPATPATPAAELAFDVNGDGAPDRVRVEPPGAVHVTLSSGRELRVRFDAPPGALRAARLAGD